MIEIKPVTNHGQLKEGDVLLIEDSRKVFPAQVKKVVFPGTKQEEIILSLNRNVYFILHMYLSGESWVKNVSIVIGATLTSISNTAKSYN